MKSFVRVGIFFFIIIIIIASRFENIRAQGNFPSTDTVVWQAQGLADAQGVVTYKCLNTTGNFYVATSICQDRLGEP